MEDTIGLAGSLGLINKGGAAFGGNVLTRAANKELEISVAEKKAEAARLAKQAQEEKLLINRIRPSGKFDELARKNMEKAYADVVINKKYNDPEEVYKFGLYKDQQEQATRERATAKEVMTKNDYVTVLPKDRQALIDHDIPYLTERAKDPASGITADPNLSDVFHLAPEKMIKRLDANKMMTDIGSNIPKDAPSYDYSQKSKTMNINGKNVIVFPVKNEILNRVAENVFGYGVEGATQGNPEIAENFKTANKQKIDAEIAANPKLTPYEATKKVFIDVLREKTMGGDENKPASGKGSNFNWSFTNGGANNGEIELLPVTGKAGARQINYLKGKNPQLKSYNIQGTDENGNTITMAFSNIPTIQKHSDGSVSVSGAVSKDDETGEVVSGTIYNVQPSELQANLSITPKVVENIETPSDSEFDKLLEVKARKEIIDKVNLYRSKDNQTNSEERFGDAKVTKYIAYKPKGTAKKVESTKPAAEKAATAKSAKSVKMDIIKSKVGTKGFEGYTEKELVDYYKSQGYTVN